MEVWSDEGAGAHRPEDISLIDPYDVTSVLLLTLAALCVLGAAAMVARILCCGGRRRGSKKEA
jgi:hypothetical protein